MGKSENCIPMTELPFAPASERNKQPILDRLPGLLPEHGSLLEIGSGTGQHAIFFAARFPGLEWQTSECAGEIDGLAARLDQEGGPNLPAPLQLDVLNDEWPDRKFAAAFSANTSHIMSWEAVCAMFGGIAGHLVQGGRFCLYGPFNRNGTFTAPSNEDFHRQLRARNPEMGLRSMETLESLAREHRMVMEQQLEMPTNNFLLVFRKI
jgi:cyclopropane fatty-acyl-phospholipid synthase-like methyltransferase